MTGTARSRRHVATPPDSYREDGTRSISIRCSPGASRNICFEIGEAAKQIESIDRDELGRSRFDRWPAVIRMRDFLGHNYPTADSDVLWRTLTNDLPAIAVAVEERIAGISDGEFDR